MAVTQEWAEGVSLLLESGADIKTSSNDTGDTVLHLAARSGNYTLLEELLSIPDSKKVLEYRNEEKHTPLMSAAYEKHLDCIELLHKCGADPTNSLPGDYTLLHIAAEKGSKDVISFLLGDESTGFKLKDIRCKEVRGGLTPLHIAAKNGYSECVEELLEKGCDVLAPTTIEPERSSTALHLAASRGHERVVEVILEAAAKEALGAVDGNGWYPLHVAALNGHGPCVRLMLLSGADVAATVSDSAGRRTGLEVITYCVPQPVAFLEDIFDSYIEANDLPVSDAGCEIKVKYDILVPEGDSKKQMSVLNAILNSGRRKLEEHLLLHPIVETFLCLKWRRLRGFFFLLMTFYLLLTFSLTSLAFLHYVLKGYSETFISVCVILSQIVLVISFLPILITEILNASQLQRYYLKDYETWVKWSVFVGTWAVGVTNPGVWWARYLASVTVLLAWIELLFFIARCPSWGYYVLMFSRVAINVFKVLGTFVFLLLGFTFSFMIHFESTEPFGSVWGALVKVLVMMIELDYGGTFPETEPGGSADGGGAGETDAAASGTSAPANEAAFFLLGRAIFLAFVVLVAIVLTNLMVGLAVSDISLLEAQGRTQRLAKQIGFLSLLEFFVYNDLLLRCLPRRLRRALERSRCASSAVTVRPAAPLGDSHELPRCLREAVLDKVASTLTRSDLNLAASLQRLDQRVGHLASELGRRRPSLESNSPPRPKNLDQTLSAILKEVRELRSELGALKSANNVTRNACTVEEEDEDNSPRFLLV